MVPLSIATHKKVHFVGIGGIGMSGIAEVLATLGYQVSGSDITENANVMRLRTYGVTVYIGHHADHVKNVDVVVVSTDIKPTNEEVEAARFFRIPVIRRADMLAELMRFKPSVAISGTHGKTTTTSLMASFFDAAGVDPTVINGGIINAYGTNARLGDGEWIVVEADESDGSFLRLPSTIAVVTNIDPEHMAHYGTFDALKKAFLTFVEDIPFYGLGILCVDHPEVRALVPQITDRRVITYGFAEDAHVRGLHLRLSPTGTMFDVDIISPTAHAYQAHQAESVAALPKRLKDLFLPMVGAHNVQNALSCIAVAHELGWSEEVIRKALTNFSGVKRRFTYMGAVKGVTIIDDYAHHPVEIQTVMKAARQACSARVIAVVQPHRYSRLQDLFEDFATCCTGADTVILAPVYSAGEDPIEGVTHTALATAMTHPDHHTVSGYDDLPEMIARLAMPGDMVVCMGAGSISQWASKLVDDLAPLLLKKAASS